MEKWSIYLCKMDVSSNIKSIRESKNIKQIDVAKALDLDPSYYYRLEKERGSKLTLGQLEKIAGALGVSVIELLTGETTKIGDSEREKELEKRVGELEDRIKDKEALINLKDKRFKDLQEYFTQYLYEEIAIMGYKYGFSQVRCFDRKTGKTLIYVTFESEGLLNDGVLFEPTYSKFMLDIESSNYKQLDFNEIGYEYLIIPEFKEVATAFYFYALILTSYLSKGLASIIILKSGIIEDKLLLFGFENAFFEKVEDIEGSRLYFRQKEIPKNSPQIEKPYVMNIDMKDFEQRIKKRYNDYLFNKP